MISTLHIKNIGIINDLTINLNEGFNVMTGETGAGKSLIVDSLAIISGGRFSKEMIRKGENHSFVELSIYSPNNEIAIDGNIIVSREIYLNGRNMCKINGRLVTVNELKEFMSKIIAIHGQQDTQLLFSTSEYINYVDGFVGKQIEKIREKYTNLFKEYNEIKAKLKNNYGDEKEKERKLDLLNYQLNEISEAKLKKGEDEELEIKRKKILSSEKLQENLNNIDIELNENAITSISTSIRNLEKIEDCGDEYKEKLTQLKNIYYDVQELARDISNMKEDIFFDEQERNEIEERLDTIFSLKRKYGNSIEEILKYEEKLKQEIEEIENKDEYNRKLKINLSKTEDEMLKLCEKMNELRNNYSKILSEKINEELKDLEMFNATFFIKVEKEKEFNINGLNKIEFLICTNIGEEAKELAKIASGGEMSRIMLAIKTVLADIVQVPVIIFDEIDTGISGKAAKAVAEKLKFISKTHQIICITHLASIAAKGDYNYYIYKSVAEGKTYTEIKRLNENQIIEEIARISSGEVTELAKQHAIELRKISTSVA